MPYKRRKSHKIRNALAAIVIAIILISVIAVVANRLSSGPSANSPTGAKILLETTMGNITIQLYNDMHITAGNFLNLTEHGIYDGTPFNRVAAGFVIQGGDTTAKGITVPPIKDELPNKHSNVAGAVAMAKESEPNSAASIPNSATSQFFINLKDNSATLDADYSVFGQVIAGMDIVNKIGQVPTTPTGDGTPNQNITIIRAIVIS
jgi:peptidylprolyl isomerase